MDEFATTNQDVHEARLVDLIATLILRRAWVFWTTIVGTLFAVVGLYLLPIIGIDLLTQRSVTLQAQVNFVSIPTNAQNAFSLDIPAMIESQTRNTKLIGAAYRDTLMTTEEGRLEPSALNRVVAKFLEKRLKIYPDNHSSTLLVTLTVRKGQQEEAIHFLVQVLETIHTNMSGSAARQISQAVAGLLISTKATNEFGAASLAPYEIAANTLKGVLDNADFPFRLPVSIDVIDDAGTPSLVTLVTMFFGSVVLGVLLAFGVEAIERLRTDLSRLDRLRNAKNR